MYKPLFYHHLLHKQTYGRAKKKAKNNRIQNNRTCNTIHYVYVHKSFYKYILLQTTKTMIVRKINQLTISK